MTLSQKLYQIASQYNIFECDKCAKALRQFIKRQGKRVGIKQAQQIRVETGYTRISDIKSRITYDGQLISYTGYHLAIEIDGMVYDNLNPRGIAKAQWASKFERVIDDSIFNRTVFGRYDTFIVTETKISI